MAAPDPSWKDFAGYLWAVLLIPVGMVWKKADGSASREELMALGKRIEESFETHRKEDRESFRQIFQNAEADRTMVRNGLDGIIKAMHDSENRLRDKIEAK